MSTDTRNTRFFLDIETIPCQRPGFLEELQTEAEAEKLLVKAPANYKDEEKITDYIRQQWLKIDDEVDARFRKTALDGALGEIVVISVAADNEAPVAIYSAEKTEGCGNGPSSEAMIISDFFSFILARCQFIHQIQIIGHNVLQFDLRFIYQRAVINGIKPPTKLPFRASQYDDTVFDTMTRWAGYGNRISLDKLTKALGIPPKGTEIGEEIDGSKVWDFVRAGRIAEVAKYCNADVERVRAIYNRMNFNE